MHDETRAAARVSSCTGAFFSRLLLVMALSLSAVTAAAAQTSLRVNVLRPLSFDRLAPVAPSLVATAAPTDTGVFEILGLPGTEVEIWFALPAVFDGPSGAALSARFDATSAAYSFAQTTADRIPFDPRQRLPFRIPASGRMLVFIAGRVLVAADQRPGRYQASIVLFANEIQ